MRFRAWFIVALGLGVTPASHCEDDYARIFGQALDRVDFEFDRYRAYTETRVDGEHVRIARFDPR